MGAEITFGVWLKQRRRMLDLTQAELARQVGCAVVTIRKFEDDERRPSKELAERLAACLNLALEEYDHFIAFARAEPYLDAVSPPATQPIGAEKLPSTLQFPMLNYPPALSPASPFYIPHNLPAQSTPFVGRTKELADIAAHLAGPTCRLLTLVGPGGIGKTRLALEAAAAQVNVFLDGVIFIALAGLDETKSLVPAIAAGLNFSFSNREDPQTQLLKYLRQKKFLLDVY